jgi:hypothetical protein
MKRDNIKRRKTNINQGVEVEVEVDRKEKNIVIVKKKRRKSTVREEMKGLNKKIEIREKKR